MPEKRKQNRGGGRPAELLDGAYLRGVNLTAVGPFEGSRLRDAVLSAAGLRDVNLSGADLREADLQGADLTNAKLRNADLTNADLRPNDQLPGREIPLTNLTNADLREADLSGANLREADLSGADLREADLSGADLREADLSGADLREADLSGADLREADLSGADLREADLSGADLRDIELFRTDLRDGDLSGKNLCGVNLIGADLREANLENARANGSTQAGKTLRMAVGGRFLFLDNRHRGEAAADSETDWDGVARSYHALKEMFRENGLISKARDMHILERRARGLESKASSKFLDGWINLSYWGSLGSRWLTGYGVRVGRLILVMIALFAVGAQIYAIGGIENSVYYSVHTFTTNPPTDPPENEPLVRLMAMFQTFVGTVLVVLLGYVLGNRQQV